MKLKPICIGKLKIDVPLFLAPMAGITDLPFRLHAKKYGAGAVITEMVSSRASMFKNPKTLKRMHVDEREHPVGIQLFGAETKEMAEAAVCAQKIGADFININLGCPSRKIMKSGCGLALAQKTSVLGNMFESVRDAVKIPVTVKFRKGTQDYPDSYKEVAKIAYDSGMNAVFFHARLKEQAHSGPADIDACAELVQLISIPVVFNGGIDSPQKALEVYKKTNCAGLMIGQPAIGAPNLFGQISEYFETGKYTKPGSQKDNLRLFLELLKMNYEYYKSDKSLIQLRKILPFYTKNIPSTNTFKKNFYIQKDYQSMVRCVEDFIGLNS